MTPRDGKAAWWKGSHGEWYVIMQIAFIILIAVGPRTWNGWPGWRFPEGRIVLPAGLVLFLAGVGLVAAGALKLGSALTPLPSPGARAALQETGAYRLIRHPMYSGAFLAAFGWALISHGWLRIFCTAAACLFIDLKVRRKEKWLQERFPEYEDYRHRVRKFIPFVY